MCIIVNMPTGTSKYCIIALYPKTSPQINKEAVFYLSSYCLERVGNSDIIGRGGINTTLEITDKIGYAKSFTENLDYVAAIAKDINIKYPNYNAVVEPINTNIWKSLK